MNWHPVLSVRGPFRQRGPHRSTKSPLLEPAGPRQRPSSTVQIDGIAAPRTPDSSGTWEQVLGGREDLFTGSLDGLRSELPRTGLSLPGRYY